MGTFRSSAATQGKLIGMLCGCILIELLFGRFLARAGFYIPKSGIVASAYNVLVFAASVAFNASALLVYLLIGWRVYVWGKRQPTSQSVWQSTAMVLILVLGLLSLLRLVWPFGAMAGIAYQVTFLAALLSCVGAVIANPSRRRWGVPVFGLFLSQLCVRLFAMLQNTSGVDGSSLLLLYRLGEVLLLASGWAFLCVALKYLPTHFVGVRCLRSVAVLVMGTVSIFCGVAVYLLCVRSPYPRQMVMFATGLTMDWGGVAFFAISVTAALLGLCLCLTTGREGRHIGACFLLVGACGYALEVSLYYLLCVVGVWFLSDASQPAEEAETLGGPEGWFTVGGFTPRVLQSRMSPSRNRGEPVHLHDALQGRH